MPVFNNILAGAAGQTGGAAAAGPIKSVRFNDGDSAYLNRTPSSAGNTKTWTFSCWVKRSSKTVANNPALLSAGANSQVNGFLQITFESDEFSTYMRHSGGTNYAYTNAKLRDNSAWYHLVVAIDTTAATEADRLKMYINGVEQTFRISSIPSLNQTFLVNDTALHQIAATKNSGGTTNNFLPGYLADLYLIDGQALDPTSFGAFDDNGVWQAAAYTGTYGTNGFHLFDFANESGIGDDSSGNDNDFTVNNLTAAVDVDATPLPTAAGDAFNADTADYAYSGSTTKFTFATAESVSNGRVDLIGRTGANYTYKAITNAGTFTLTEVGTWPGLTAGTYTAHYSVTDSSITSLTAIQCESASGSWTLSGVQVAGDPSSVGDQLLVKSVGQFQDLDVLRDVPTNGDSSDDTGAGGEVSGNYATFNPLHNNAASGGNGAILSDGNLETTFTTASSTGTVPATIFVSSGKWYCEFTAENISSSAEPQIGIVRPDDAIDGYIGQSGTNGVGYEPFRDRRYNAGTLTTPIFNQTTTSGTHTYGLALDLDDGTLDIYEDGTLLGELVSGLSGTWTFAAADIGGADVPTIIANFGQRPFAYTAPSGFKALCTANLPTPDVPDGSDYFDAKIYEGNGSTNSITGLEFSPDLVWLKSRDQAKAHCLFDTVRGVNKRLLVNTTDEEYTVANTLTSFDSNGFTLGSNNEANNSGYSHVAWAWDAGTTTDTNNTDGSITPTGVRANASAGFSIVSYTGNGGASATIGHGLNAAPEMIIVKNRDVADHGVVYHVGTDATTPQNYFLKLFETSGGTAARDDTGAMWNDTAPTSSVFSVGTEDNVNASTENYIAYCFAPVEGYSAFGSLTTNGSADGTFTYTGFRPAFILYRYSNTTGNWAIFDSKRSTYNVMGSYLLANSSNAEASSDIIDFLSNGFKFRTALTSGNTVIYACFAENPFQANGGLAR